MAGRSSGGITGKGGKNVNPVYKDSGGHVKKIVPGTKPLTRSRTELANTLRSAISATRTNPGGGISGPFGMKNK